MRIPAPVQFAFFSKLRFAKPLAFIFLGLITMSNDCETGDTGGSTTAVSNDPPNVAWASRRDLSTSSFSDYFDDYNDRGYIIKDVDAYPGGSGLLYSMIWEDNADNRNWAEWRNLTSEEYHTKWEQYRDQGYRPTDVEGYLSGSNLLFAGIWEDNIENIGWSSHRGLTASEYGDLFEEKSDDGFRLVDMEAYQTNSGLRYACIWYANVDNIGWYQYRDMGRDSYQAKIDELSEAGFRVIDFESYIKDGTQRYAAIWEENVHNHAYVVRSDRSEVEYANYWRQYRDMGYRLIDFERYNTPSGTRYAGVWTENSPRYRWDEKGDIDQLVLDYQSANDIPGISVAIIQSGDIVYQRGFGFAEIDQGKAAHGKSVYLLASISKVIGGTLAAKLEDEGELADGTAVSLDLTQRTTNYIPISGDNHRHTVQQMLSHLGCVWHYDTGPEPPNLHYSTALAASATIWNTATLSGCSIGTNRNYSTHAFTFVGAVLEAVSGRSIAQLVEEEIADQYNLGSMKVQYRTSSLPGNYERVAPYSDNGNETSYSDNSWKVLGGGIESDAVDLARFGWKVRNGQIVDATARDSRLWTRVVSNQRNGLAWELNSTNGRNVAEHGGSWTGSRTHLRVYRDPGEELVIAVLTNISSGHDPADLVDDIGEEILNP